MGTSLFSGIPNEYPMLRTDMWSLIFPPEMGISERFEVTAARPKVTNASKDVKYKGSHTFYKGSTKFEPMTMTFRDVVGPAVMQKLWNWQRQHYDPITGCGGYASIYKKNLTLYMEDDCGNPVQMWTAYGCFITSLDGGGLDMKQDAEIAQVTLTVQMDYWDLEY